mgnify:CR=1 FL=1
MIRHAHAEFARGILEPGLTYLVMNWGLAHTSVVHASLIGATEPLLIALLAWVLIRSPLPRRLFLPMGTALIGTVLVVTTNADASGAHWLGDAAVALGFVFASLYAVGSASVVADHPPLAVTLLQQLFAYAVIAPPLLVVCAVSGVGTSTSGFAWAAVPLIGIATSSLTFWLYLTSLRHVSPGTTAQFLALGASLDGKRTLLLCGDLTFLHDSNALLSAYGHPGDLTVLVINNQGGGIFNHLPVARETRHFERLWGTPQAADLAKLCAAHKTC